MAEEDFFKEIEEYLDKSIKISCRLPKYKVSLNIPELKFSISNEIKEKEAPRIIEKKRKKKSKSKELF